MVFLKAISQLQVQPSLEHLTQIYANAMGLRICSERLINSGFQLKRLSLNTEVVAAKEEQMGQPFSVIARDVRVQAERIASEMAVLQSACGELAGYAVASLARSRICEKYEEVLKTMTPGANRDLLILTRERTAAALMSALQGLEQGLKTAHDKARNLTRLSIHLPVVAIMFRIESARARRAAADLFRGMGAELILFSETFTQDLELLLDLSQITLSLFSKCDSHAGVL